MNLRPWTSLLALAVALVATPGAARAQTVVGLQNLAFGTVIPGVPTTVLPSDAVRAAQFRITGVFLNTVTVTFTLPPVMNRIGGGASIPLAFGNTAASWQSPFSGQTPFNPNTPYSAFILFGTYNVFLGGTATPAPSQLGGNYTGNVVITVVAN